MPTKATSAAEEGRVVNQVLIVASAANTVELSDVTEAITEWASELAEEVKLMPAELNS